MAAGKTRFERRPAGRLIRSVQVKVNDGHQTWATRSTAELAFFSCEGGFIQGESDSDLNFRTVETDDRLLMVYIEVDSRRFADSFGQSLEVRAVAEEDTNDWDRPDIEGQQLFARIR